MNPFITADVQKELDEIAKDNKKTAAQVEALQKATEGQKANAVKQAGLQYEAIQTAAATKNLLDNELAEAYRKGGVVTIKVSAQAADSEKPVEMEINLSNLVVGNNQNLATHRDRLRVDMVSYAAQQVQLAMQHLREQDPVSLDTYLEEKKKQAG